MVNIGWELSVYSVQYKVSFQPRIGVRGKLQLESRGVGEIMAIRYQTIFCLGYNEEK